MGNHKGKMSSKSPVVAALLLALVAGAAHFTPVTASTTTTILASEDTYVDSSKPSTNFGGLVTTWVRGGSPARRALLRFNLSAIPAGAQITSATLRLYVSSDGSAVAGSLWAVSGAWAETTVTYASAPPVGGLIRSLPNPATAGGSVSASVTSYVAGKSRVDLYLASSSSDGVVYYTREKASSLAPRLIITWSSATSTPTRTATAAITRTPTRTPTTAVTWTPTRTPTRTPTPTATNSPVPAATATATATGIGGDPVVMAAGDIVCDSLTTSPSSCQQMAVSQLILDQQPSAVLPLGDLCHTPSVDCFNNYYGPSWGRFFDLSNPVPGNHDYLVPEAVDYFDYWNGAGNQAGRAGTRGQGFYSYELGTWHIIALNSNCGDIGGCNLGSAEYMWLQQDLLEHPSLCTLAYWHIPVFSSGGRASPNMQQIFTLLWNANADIVLNGHDHIYERYFPIGPDGYPDAQRGVRQFIVGTGGANHTSIEAVTPGSEVRNWTTFGALKLTLRHGAYDWQFMPAAGGTFSDASMSACH